LQRVKIQNACSSGPENPLYKNKDRQNYFDPIIFMRQENECIKHKSQVVCASEEFSFIASSLNHLRLIKGQKRAVPLLQKSRSFPHQMGEKLNGSLCPASV